MLRHALLLVLVYSSFALPPAVIQLTEPVDHGEGPVWDERTKLLYFVDMYSGILNSYDICTEEHRSIQLNGDLTVAVPSVSDASLFLAGLNRSVITLVWDGKNDMESYEVLTTIEEDKPLNRFNDGKADSEGRLWFGTMGHEITSGVVESDQGSLYLITKENLEEPEARISPVTISNGLAWNRANDKFYYIDTATRQVVEYDYDSETATISNRTVVFDMADYSESLAGNPDGMTIDIEDNLWVALYGGGAVIKVNPREKRLMQVVALPAHHVTSACWGGTDYDILFVTTSRFYLSEEEKLWLSAAGSLFAVKNLGTRGLPSFRADICSS